MTIRELYDVTPQAYIFIVRRDEQFNVVARRTYLGGIGDTGRKVARIVPAHYPSYGIVLEVELED